MAREKNLRDWVEDRVPHTSSSCTVGCFLFTMCGRLRASYCTLPAKPGHRWSDQSILAVSNMNARVGFVRKQWRRADGRHDLLVARRHYLSSEDASGDERFGIRAGGRIDRQCRQVWKDMASNRNFLQCGYHLLVRSVKPIQETELNQAHLYSRHRLGRYEAERQRIYGRWSRGIPFPGGVK